MSSPPPRAHATWLAPLLVALIWGVNGAVIRKAVTGELHPFAFNAVRLTLSVLVLAALLAWQRRRREPAPVPMTRVLLVGVLGPLLNQCLSVSAFAHTSTGNAALIGASAPVWTALIAVWLGVERVASRTWLAIALTCAGTAAINLHHGFALSGGHWLGNLFALGASLTWALTNIASAPLVGRISPTQLACWSTATVLPVHAGLLMTHEPASWSLSWTSWVCILYSGVVSTGLAYVLWNATVRRIGPSLAMVYSNMVPLFAIAAAGVLLDEPVTPVQFVGGGLILTGVVLAGTRKRAG